MVVYMNSTGCIGSLRKRFPDWNELLTVFSFVIFAVYSWAIYAFLDHLSSNLLNIGPGEIAVIFFFEMAIALLESLLVCGVILLLSAIFPRRWLCEGFAAKGFLVAAAGAAVSIISSRFASFPLPAAFLEITAFCLILLIASIILLNYHPQLQNGLRSLVNRFTIFTYLYMPLGIIGILVVVFRNLF
jgi:hypothetical protein